MPGGIGGPELLIVFLVVLLIFGPTKIPEVARGIGKGLREIRRLTTDLQREINLADSEVERRPARATPARPTDAAAEKPAPADEEPDEAESPPSPAYEEIDEQVLDSPAPAGDDPDGDAENVKPDV